MCIGRHELAPSFKFHGKNAINYYEKDTLYLSSMSLMKNQLNTLFKQTVIRRLYGSPVLCKIHRGEEKKRQRMLMFAASLYVNNNEMESIWLGKILKVLWLHKHKYRFHHFNMKCCTIWCVDVACLTHMRMYALLPF